MRIDDVRDDYYAVEIIDELKFRLKRRTADGPAPIADALDAALNAIIEQFRLDSDPHHFAVLRE